MAVHWNLQARKGKTPAISSEKWRLVVAVRMFAAA